MARIFRVIPGIDACKTCLSVYYQEDGGGFIKIEEDPALPIITTECNNPIRPASAADLKLIASLAARMVLEYLEKGNLGFNHWIWSSEALPGLPVSSEIPFIVKSTIFAATSQLPSLSGENSQSDPFQHKLQ